MVIDVRPAERSDLPALAAVEAAADALYLALFGDMDWEPPRSGQERAAAPGFLLVATYDGAVVGFAHVLETEGACHLEQLAVDPAYGRRGIGSTLVRAVLEEAARRGHREVSLRTYADVPWNAPFYRRLGFREALRLTPFLRRVRDHERDAGLERHGPRVVMVAPAGGHTTPGAAS